MKWFRKAAEQNFAKAKYRLGIHYSLGSGVTKDDVVAFSWYRKAAEQNDAEAQCQLGDCYSQGKGVALDWVESANWFRKAAEQNNVEAQCALGNCYEFNLGVSQDYQEAAKLYRQAINNGSEPARDMLKSLENKMTAIQNPPVPSAKIATPQVTATNVSAKVTESNASWWKWSWKLTLINYSSDPVNVNTAVRFFDQDGYLVDEDKYGVQNAALPARSSQTFTGLKMIRLPEAKNVVSVGAKVEIQ